MNKKEEKEVNKILEEENIGDHSLSTVPLNTGIAVPTNFRGIDIEGLQDIPASMIAVPYLRLIQPSSKKTETADGQETPWGKFLFSDTQESEDTLNFVLLRAKHEYKLVAANGKFVTADYTGETKSKPQVSILGITTGTNKIFILSLSSTSFSSFGKLMAKLKAMQVKKSYQFEIKMTSEKTENDKGKYAIVNFMIGKEISGEDLARMAKVAFEYGLVLDRQSVEEDSI